MASSTATIIGDDQQFDPMPWISAAPRSHHQETCALNQRDQGALVILFGADHYRSRLPQGGSLLAWDKHVGRGPDDSFSDCEWMWCGRKVRREVFRHLWKGVIAKRNIDDISPIKGGKGRCSARFARVHVSQKPVALMRWCIEKLKPPPGGVILDPYMGSGTTGIAALSLGMRFTGVEIDEEHFKTACARIEGFWQKHGSSAP